MDVFGANPVDIVVIIVIAVSALLALVRGFVAEVMTVVGLIVAMIAVLHGIPYLAPYVVPHLEGAFKSEKTLMLATRGVSGVILFFGTLAVTSAASYVISRRIQQTHLSAIDRSLGFLFGLVRGALLVCLMYICVTFVFPPAKDGEEPETGSFQAVLKEARTGPALASGAHIISSFAPDKGLSLDELTRIDSVQQLMQSSGASSDAPPASGLPERSPEDFRDVIDRATLSDAP